MKRKITGFLTDLFFYVLSALVYSAAINIFIVPNGFAQGGFTGIGILLNYLFNFHVGRTILLLNIPLFIVSFFVFGKGFIFKTAVATVISSVAIDLTKGVFPIYTKDKILSALFAGLLTGLGLSLCFLRGATTGGTDIISKLVRKSRPHISLGKIIMVTDILIITATAIILKSFESAMYSAVSVTVCTSVIDYILYGTGGGKLIITVTDNAENIKSEIFNKLGRGVTSVKAVGGYSETEKNMLFCVVKRSQVFKINEIIKNNDENAFTLISNVGEILGNGFKNNQI